MNIRRNNLTLIELLIVIGIATLLMATVVPSFRKIMTGNAVDQAASQLKLGLEMAQSHAISSRRYVAIILPQGNASDWSTDEEKNAILGGFRLAYVKRKKVAGATDVSSDWIFDQWVLAESWTSANKNARLVKIATSKAKAEPQEQGVKNCLKNSNALLTSSSDYPGSDATIGTKALPLKTVLDYEGHGSDKSDMALIFSPLGGLADSMVSTYLVVAEAVQNGNTFIFPGKGTDGPFNVKVIRINNLTGAVEFVL